MTIDGNFIVSVITAIVAIIALVLTLRQIKLSNKQHLFDKRMENYLIAMGLIQLYENNHRIFNEKEDGPLFALDYDFALLTNNTYLEQITPVIDNPLKGANHKNFLIKLEDLNEVGTKIKFLFSKNEAKVLSDFVFSYRKVLFSMYQYQITLNKMHEINRDHKLSLEEIQQVANEPEQRIKLQKDFQNLKQVYELLKKKNIEKYIEKQIKLL
ncbi:hypothetical protein [Clostridium baratii]|uniref:hypothetical protein n=1 Tax=Clostridium baratii TaxID=1561 RepID=UPI0006BA9F68|nr:hypothetical protein [Clostridium baratii]